MKNYIVTYAKTNPIYKGTNVYVYLKITGKSFEDAIKTAKDFMIPEGDLEIISIKEYKI